MFILVSGELGLLYLDVFSLLGKSEQDGLWFLNIHYWHALIPWWFAEVEQTSVLTWLLTYVEHCNWETWKIKSLLANVDLEVMYIFHLLSQLRTFLSRDSLS